MPNVPVFLIQLANEFGSQSREEKVGECLPDGFCCNMHDNFCIAWALLAGPNSCLSLGERGDMVESVTG